MKGVVREKRIRSYSMHFRHRYRFLFFVITSLCSLVTLVLFLRESNSSFRVAASREKNSDFQSLKTAIITSSEMKKNVSPSYFSMTSANTLQIRSKKEPIWHMSVSQDLSSSSVHNRSTSVMINSLPSKLCESPLLDVNELVPNSTKNDNGLYRNITSTDTFELRLVHFDLKGAPPKVEYFEKILPILQQNGATGILLEYEDMFPFYGPLASITAPNAYCPSDIKRILKTAEKLQLQVIPLIQTFGHMEFVLKLGEFQDLRETNASTSAICPSNPRSFQLVTTMIDQVMSLHPHAKWLHIGCDEVFYLGICKLCNKYQYNRDILYLKYVSKIARYVRERYDAVPIIWDDMIRRTSSRVLKAVEFGNLVEPMVWVYAENVSSLFFPSMWVRYRMIFKHVWAASAFKGAFGRDLLIPNAERHYHNHISWLAVKSLPGIKFINFRGIALTGWQRYEHFGPLCELLPVGLPSLILNLLTVFHNGSTQNVLFHLRQALNCSSALELPSSLAADPFLQHTMKSCNFPGSAIFQSVQRYHMIKKRLSHGFHNVCDFEQTNSTKSTFFMDVQNFSEQFIDCKVKIENFKEVLRNALKEVFDNFTISEWFEQNVRPIERITTTLVTISRNKSAFFEACEGFHTATKLMRIFPKIYNQDLTFTKCS